ncbi:nucleoside-diphosphate-sugar epimerase [Methylobacterium brachythecii]|nr:nucleoside-diphosphate-sugar epimerase [Methylobacterium brachythecii]
MHALVRNGLRGVIHCGAHSGPMVARENPFSMVEVNIVGTANMLEIARIHGASRFIYCSSTSAFGPTPPGPVPEDIALQPKTVYGASKVAGEQLVSTYASQYGLDGTSLRISWVFGPRRSTDCAIRTMIADAQAGSRTRFAFGKDFPRQYIYVDDAANALIQAFDRPELPRRVYTVTGGTYKTLGEIADLVRSIIPGADIELGAGADPVDDLQHEFDISAARRDLDYAPRHDLETRLRTYAAWLAEQSKAS